MRSEALLAFCADQSQSLINAMTVFVAATCHVFCSRLSGRCVSAHLLSPPRQLHSPSRALCQEFVNSPRQRLSGQSDRGCDVMVQKPTCGRLRSSPLVCGCILANPPDTHVRFFVPAMRESRLFQQTHNSDDGSEELRCNSRLWSGWWKQLEPKQALLDPRSDQK